VQVFFVQVCVGLYRFVRICAGSFCVELYGFPHVFFVWLVQVFFVWMCRSADQVQVGAGLFVQVDAGFFVWVCAGLHTLSTLIHFRLLSIGGHCRSAFHPFRFSNMIYFRRNTLE